MLEVFGEFRPGQSFEGRIRGHDLRNLCYRYALHISRTLQHPEAHCTALSRRQGPSHVPAGMPDCEPRHHPRCAAAEVARPADTSFRRVSHDYDHPIHVVQNIPAGVPVGQADRASRRRRPVLDDLPRVHTRGVSREQRAALRHPGRRDPHPRERRQEHRGARQGHRCTQFGRIHE